MTLTDGKIGRILQRMMDRAVDFKGAGYSRVRIERVPVSG